MEDSLEDYLRLSRNVKGKIKNENEQETMKNAVLTIQKKKESETRAMKIVEFMIEGKLRVETFLQCLLHINQEYYQDIVEERALNKLCGYSICSQKLPEMPKKKYHISSKQNKVYDITDRKNYCSNFCYKASLHIKKQIETSPLWLRSADEIPNFKLLSPASGGLPGEEIDQGIAKPVEDAHFASVWSFTSASLNELAENEVKSKSKRNKEPPESPKMPSIKEGDELEDVMGEYSSRKNEYISNIKNDNEKSEPIVKSNTECKRINEPLGSEKNENKIKNEHERKFEPDMNSQGEDKKSDQLVKGVHIKNRINNLLPANSKENINLIPKNKEKDQIEETTADQNCPKKRNSMFADRRKTQKKANTTTTEVIINSQAVNNVLEHINKCVCEWITLQTYLFLYGEERLAQVLNQSEMKDMLNSLRISDEKTQRQSKYLELCRKLHLKEIAEEIFHERVTGKNLKPLPDYEKLKEESKNMDLKVRSFYQGVPYEIEKSCGNKKVNEGNSDKNGNSSQKNTASEEVNPDEGPPAVVPLVDVKSQNALRRKVFLSSLTKVLQNFADLFQFSIYRVQSDVQDLIKTFKLKANNVVFKPLIWNIIAIIILKIISIKNLYLKEIMENEKIHHHIEQILKPFPKGVLFINELVTRIKDVESFIHKYLND